MLRRLILVLSLIAAFGLGQHSAAVHAISHLGSEQSEQPHEQHKNAPQHSCEKCVVYAAFAGTLPSTSFALAHLNHDQLIRDDLIVVANSTSSRFYSARAPPQAT